MSKPIPSSKSPFWQYDFQLHGQRYSGSTKCKNYRDAERYIGKLRRSILLGEETDQGSSITVDAACGLWWEAVGEGLKNHATDEYRLLALVEGLGPTTLFHTLTLKELDAYVASRRAVRVIPAKTHTAKGKLVVDRPEREFRLSAASVNRELQLLRRVVLWLGKPGRGYKVPVIPWKEVLRREPGERIRELSVDEEARLFAVLPEDLAPFVKFALMTGQRRSELVNLKWSDVDLVEGRATTVLKGGEPHKFPLSDDAMELLKSLPRQADIPQVFTYVCAGDQRCAHNPKLARIKGNRYPLSKQGWTRKWRKALAEAGIEDFHFHDLRHTCATRLVRDTGNLKLAQKLLGHTEIATTGRYAHAMEDDLRAALNRGAQSRKTPGPTLRVVEND